MDGDQISLELKKLRFWLALGAIGLLLTGVGMIGSMFAYDKLFELAEEAESKDSEQELDFEDEAAELYDENRLSELWDLIEERVKKRPNDADVYWWRAKYYMTSGEYEQALNDLETTQLHSPGWNEKHIEPFRQAIRLKIENEK